VVPLWNQEAPIGRGDQLFRIEWEGHQITSADELYHTVWNTVTGSTTVTAPVAGNILGVMQDSPGKKCVLDSQTIVAELVADEDSMDETKDFLLTECEHATHMDGASPGMFASVEEM